jgi:hypothetical protein
MVRSRALRGVSNHEVLGLSFETHRFALLLRVRLKKATNEMSLLSKLVMPGLRPGHPRLGFTQARKAWMAGTKPGHDEKGVIFKRLESA